MKSNKQPVTAYVYYEKNGGSDLIYPLRVTFSDSTAIGWVVKRIRESATNYAHEKNCKFFDGKNALNVKLCKKTLADTRWLELTMFHRDDDEQEKPDDGYILGIRKTWVEE